MTFVPKALRSPNGKGDKDRTADREAYRKNFDRIFGGKPNRPPPGWLHSECPKVCSLMCDIHGCALWTRVFGRKEPECGGAVNCGLFTGKRTQPCGACRD